MHSNTRWSFLPFSVLPQDRVLKYSIICIKPPTSEPLGENGN